MAEHVALDRMTDEISTPTLPGSKLRCCETDEKLVFYFPPRPLIGWVAAVLIVAALLACLGFLGFMAYHLGWFFLPIGLFIGTIALLVLGFGFLAVTQRYLAKTFVSLTGERLVVKSILWGREQEESHKLTERSLARLYWPRIRHRDPPKRPQGIELALENTRALEHTREGSFPVFGDSLSWGEQDWVVWRVNRFLGGATDSDAPEGVSTARKTAPVAIEGLPEQPLPPPDGIKVCIEESVFETRFVFPNTMQMGSRKGVGTFLIGAAWAAGTLFYLLQSRQGLGGTALLGVFAVVGLLVMLTGLLRLFGCSQLTITPERTTLQTTLFGIGPWAGVPTAEVISVKGSVIRSASKQVRFGDQLRDATGNQAEIDWLLDEIAVRIQAARTGMSVPSIRHRHGPPTRRRVATTRKSPSGTIPYDIHRRPLPSGHDLNTLLPVEVGPFHREPVEEPAALDDEPIYMEYGTDQGKIFVELSICPDSDDARRAVAVAHAEASESGASEEVSVDTDPSFHRMTAPDGAFMAWSRGNYYFSASVRGKSSQQVLDQFMNAFPY